MSMAGKEQVLNEYSELAVPFLMKFSLFLYVDLFVTL